MSWTDEEIDNLFREGAKTQSFEYDNSYFSEIEAALPVSRKGRDFLWLGTALMFVAALTTGYFIQADNLQESAINPLAGTNVAPTDNGSTQTNVTTPNLTVVKSETNGAVNANASVPTTEVAQRSNKVSFTSSNLGEGSTPTASSASNTHSMYDVATRNIRHKHTASPMVNAVEMNAIASNEGQAQNASQLGERLAAAQTTPDQKSAPAEQLPITASLGVKSASQLENGLNVGLAPNALPLLSEIRPKAALYAELNAGMSQSMITPSDYTSNSIGGGLGVETYLGNFNLTTGLNFAVSNHKDLKFTTEGKIFGFGSTLRTHHYSYEQVYNLDLPITIGYNFGNHNVNLGVRTSVLLGAKVNHTVFDNNEMVRSEKIYGLAGGLERFAVRPTVGYAYRMKNWTVGANVGVQLMQAVNEDYIKGFNNSFPIDGQIYLRRTIKLRK